MSISNKVEFTAEFRYVTIQVYIDLCDVTLLTVTYNFILQLAT